MTQVSFNNFAIFLISAIYLFVYYSMYKRNKKLRKEIADLKAEKAIPKNKSVLPDLSELIVIELTPEVEFQVRVKSVDMTMFPTYSDFEEAEHIANAFRKAISERGTLRAHIEIDNC